MRASKTIRMSNCPKCPFWARSGHAICFIGCRLSADFVDKVGRSLASSLCAQQCCRVCRSGWGKESAGESMLRIYATTLRGHPSPRLYQQYLLGPAIRAVEANVCFAFSLADLSFEVGQQLGKLCAHLQPPEDSLRLRSGYLPVGGFLPPQYSVTSGSSTT